SRPGDLTFSIVRRFVAETVTVSEAAIREAAAFLLGSEHLLVEWSGAVGVAALLAGAVRAPGVPTAVVLSGGNVDPALVIDSGSAGGAPAA
ncbi:MAG TPA: pyridoxal-phosphate dependent enzyme, partial [Candidatus Polarisedimenticolia bacterium]|nr:pyridoxal-phosphate dependent enzyme [Candidatus Polarisedimenticolia bacterium]